MNGFTQAHDTINTSLQGYVLATFEQMIGAFGAPHHEYHDDKSDTEWNCKTDDGIVFTIYDYDDTNEDSRDGRKYKWHVGGFNADALRAVERITGIAPVSLQ